MDHGEQWFHSDTRGLHMLFESIALDDDKGFAKAYILVIALCSSERALTYFLDHKLDITSTNKNSLAPERSARIMRIISRTLLYGIVTAFRLLYMLVVMYLNTGLFITVVASLTMSQLFVEIAKSGHCNKTGPLSKSQTKMGYSDVPTREQSLSAVEINEDDDDDDNEPEFTNKDTRHYNIPRIVISNEKSNYSTSTKSAAESTSDLKEEGHKND